MPIEIERKFLVTSNDFKKNAKKVNINQVYLFASEQMAIRIRIDDLQASIAIKSKESERVNKEYEYIIPKDEAISMMKTYDVPKIRKSRYVLTYRDHIWEVDEFHDENSGLIIAEIELNDVNEDFDLPPWVGAEVTADYRYLNSNLASNPFNGW